MDKAKLDELKIVVLDTKQSVINLRHAGMTYEQIGQMLGISKQAAHQHYNKQAAPRRVPNLSSIPDSIFDQLSNKGKIQMNKELPNHDH